MEPHLLMTNSELHRERRYLMLCLPHSIWSSLNKHHKQVTKVFGDWNQARFEELLAQWLIACDQPFEEVE
jgi:hypothetical protein